MPRHLRTPPALAVPGALIVYGTVNLAAPLALSSLGRRAGWAASRPGIVNVLGTPLLLAGACIILRAAAPHARAWRDREWKILRIDRDHLLTPDYLVTDGPYRYTRNPLYIGDLLMWAGWTVLLGSLPVMIGLVALAVGLNVGVRLEERGLHRKFGATWDRYAATTPRFVGRVNPTLER